jgi:hypothetical protein
MKQTRTGITAQESSSHPRPAAATVADIMRPTPTTVTPDRHHYATGRRLDDRSNGSVSSVLVARLL